MKNLRLLITLLFFVPVFAFSQMTDEQVKRFVETATPREMIQKNTLMLMDGYYHQSIIVIDALLKESPENSNFNYRKGYALFNSVSDYSKTIPFLKKAETNISSVYDMFSPNEVDAPVETYFYLGRCYHLGSNIELAKENYGKFLANPPKKSEVKGKAELMLKQCEVAEDFLKNPRGYTMINLGDSINSSSPDYAPIVSLDGKALYFTSRRLREDKSNEDIKEPYKNQYLEDVYVSYREDQDNWKKPELLDLCLPERNEATVAVSTDERSIYVYKDDEGNGDIFFSEFEDSEFKKLKPLETKGINTDAWEPHLTVSPDGKYKYFTSDREGGFGGRDIYRLVKLPNGNWSAPQNLGPTINTKYDEDSPFISVDNKTLYFSHNGEKSMGGFDVFVSVMGGDQKWSDPINLGVPLNSMGDDIYYTTTADGLTGYLSSFRPNGKGEKDIYEIQNDYLGLDNVAILTGKVITTNGEKLPEDLAFTLTCMDCGDKSIRLIRPRVNDGGFFASLQPCREYEMVFHHDDGESEFHRETFKTNCEKGFEEIDKTILLDVPTMSVVSPEDTIIQVDYAYNPILLEHYFGYNNNKLSTESGSLKSLLDEMISQAENGRKSFEITVDASASKVPTRKYGNNMTLAEKRAKNMVNMLQEYIENNEVLKGKVTVKTNKIGVNGPSYVYGTFKNIDKYAPYQFVKVNVSGEENDEDSDIKMIESKDSELK
jgi:tetratricopeptide (TPR) repeat protein